MDMVLDKAEIAGFKYIYHSGPFSDWGHFNWNSSFTRNGDEGVKCMVDKAKAKGINMGVHTLSNFITTNDSYVTPVPSRHLQKQGVLTLTDDITESQTDIRIQKNDLFEIPLSLNTLQIDDELIIYNKVEKETDFFLLKDCKGELSRQKRPVILQKLLYINYLIMPIRYSSRIWLYKIHWQTGLPI